jgi:hypothetical protein
VKTRFHQSLPFSNSTCTATWRDIIANFDVVNQVMGKWFVLGGVSGGVQCNAESFERPHNAARLRQADEPSSICQCLSNDNHYAAGGVTELQLLSLADLDSSAVGLCRLNHVVP